MPFTTTDLGALREMRQRGDTIRDLVAHFGCYGFSRDEVIEAYWATVRNQENHLALGHLNFVFGAQEAGMPLISGNMAYRVDSRPLAGR